MNGKVTLFDTTACGTRSEICQKHRRGQLVSEAKGLYVCNQVYIGGGGCRRWGPGRCRRP